MVTERGRSKYYTNMPQASHNHKLNLAPRHVACVTRFMANSSGRRAALQGTAAKGGKAEVGKERHALWRS